MSPWHIVAAILIFSTLGCAAPMVRPGAPSQLPEYHIAPPDVLTISVLPAPEVTREVTVRPDGRISFPLIGDLMAQGKTVEELRREITDRIKEFIVQPDVTVTLTELKSSVYSVFGEVRRPGTYPLTGPVNVVQALGLAGGPTYFAKQDGTLLVRPTEADQLAYPVELAEITRRGNGETNYELQPGDVIYVPPHMMVRIGYGVGIAMFPIQQLFFSIARGVVAVGTAGGL